MNDKDNGLLDRQIDLDHQSAIKPLVINKASVVPKGKVSSRQKSDFSANYSNLADVMLNDAEVRVRLSQGLAWSKFMVKLLALEMAPTATRRFFTRTETHRALFHVLSYFSMEGITHPTDKDDIFFGAFLSQVTEILENTGTSQRSISRIIKSGIDDNFILTSQWRYDIRQKVIWLNPEHLVSYLTTTMELFGNANEGLPEARRDLLAAKRDNPDYDVDVRNRLLGALREDQK